LLRVQVGMCSEREALKNIIGQTDASRTLLKRIASMTNDVLTLYRGLAVTSKDAPQIRQQILERGITLPAEEDKSRWRIQWHDLRPELERLYLKPDLSYHDTDCAAHAFPVVCACGDMGGAAYYAWRHNRSAEHDTPLVIELQANVADVFVDGRDFLFTVFQLWDRGKTEPRPNDCERYAQILATLFGDAVVRYFYRAASSEDQEYRISMCRLAVQDIEVVRSHVRNTHIITGRYGTRFCSAFFVKTPIVAARIRSVTSPPYPSGSPWVSLDTLRDTP